jgi:ribosomal protein S18 acetylase RimI-like enzyme
MVECIRTWWGDSRTPEEAHELSLLLPKLFLEHFSDTSLVLETQSGIAGFLVGFYSSNKPDEAYIHFVGVDPMLRQRGIARRLYLEFFKRAAGSGRRRVRAITSPANTGSIKFHLAMGFVAVDGDRKINGIPVHSDHDGPGQDRVCFLRNVDSPSSTMSFGTAHASDV